MSASTSQALWLRAASLQIADETGAGIELAGADLSNALRIRFTCIYATQNSPISLQARVYNLSGQTIKMIQGLAQKQAPNVSGVPFATTARCTLLAGYQGSLSTLFVGQIYQLRSGYENSTDSYLDIFAASGDYFKNWAINNASLAKGHTATDKWNAIGKDAPTWQATMGEPPPGLSTTPSVRGSVLFGMARDNLDDLGRSNNFTWNMNGSQVQALPKFTPRPGSSVVINFQTGQVGFPEQTEEGIKVTCLLNPQITWGTKIQLTNTEISNLLLNQPGLGNEHGAVSPTASTSSSQVVVPPLNTDGSYVVIQVRHIGDTRGNDWYSHMIAVSTDPTAVPAKATVPLPTAS